MASDCSSCFSYRGNTLNRSFAPPSHERLGHVVFPSPLHGVEHSASQQLRRESLSAQPSTQCIAPYLPLKMCFDSLSDCTLFVNPLDVYDLRLFDELLACRTREQYLYAPPSPAVMAKLSCRQLDMLQHTESP